MLSLGLSLGLQDSGSDAALWLNFLGTETLDSRITFTRGSSATRVNSSGLIETVGNNVARFDYDPSTLAAKGLLIEEQRTNYALYSHDLTNAVWTATNCTTAKTATGPDGTANSATTVTASAGNATILQAITDASNARITSCYIKRRTGTGVVDMTQDNGATWAAVTVTSSWTRVNIASATLANPTIGLRIVTSGDAVDVWGFQNERGAFITSVIPTTTSTATRSADVATMTGTNFSSWYNQSQGTFVYNATSSVKNASAGPWLVNVTAGANANSMYSAFADTRQLRVYDGSAVEQVAIASSAVTVLQYAKVASTYKLNDFAVSANGGTVATDTSGTLPAPTQMMIGANNGSFNGWIAQLAYYSTRLPDAQLQSLTT